MLYTSVLFLCYFLPIALAMYWACAFSLPAQNLVLLVLSLVFYAWGEPLNLIPMLVLIVANHLFGRRLAGEGDGKRGVVFAATVVNILVLLLTRYGEIWFRMATGEPGTAAAPTIPFGVSFFALQALAYVYDIVRGKAAPETSIVNTGLYISFFPTVLAGPILRFGDMAAQLHARKPSLEGFGSGCERFVVGLAKLAVLAYPLGRIADVVFDRSASGTQFFDTPVTLAWLGLVAFGLYLYLAFSGCSDLAVGLGRMFGYTIKENFKYPYAAHTVADFWNRWHISLYRWFFVYVFLARGGARPRRVRIKGVMQKRNLVVQNLLILWLLISLWHGVGWNYLVFGMWFFVFCFFEWIISLQRRNTRSQWWHLYLLLVVGIGWVFLRCHSFGESMTFLSNLIGANDNGFASDSAAIIMRENWYYFALGILAASPFARHVVGWLKRERSDFVAFLLTSGHFLVLVALLFLGLVCLSRTGDLPVLFK